MERNYVRIASKDIFDEDGFLTEYTWYAVVEGEDVVNYVFVYGDSEIYYPEDGWYDHECENYNVARNWFDKYKSAYEEEMEETYA